MQRQSPAPSPTHKDAKNDKPGTGAGQKEDVSLDVLGLLNDGPKQPPVGQSNAGPSTAGPSTAGPMSTAPEHKDETNEVNEGDEVNEQEVEIQYVVPEPTLGAKVGKESLLAVGNFTMAGFTLAMAADVVPSIPGGVGDALVEADAAAWGFLKFGAVAAFPRIMSHVFSDVTTGVEKFNNAVGRLAMRVFSYGTAVGEVVLLKGFIESFGARPDDARAQVAVDATYAAAIPPLAEANEVLWRKVGGGLGTCLSHSKTCMVNTWRDCRGANEAAEQYVGLAGGAENNSPKAKR
jgi:hypothetical protein